MIAGVLVSPASMCFLKASSCSVPHTNTWTLQNRRDSENGSDPFEQFDYVLCSTSGFKRLFLMRIFRLRSFGEGRGRPDSICQKTNRHTFPHVKLPARCNKEQPWMRRRAFTGKFSRDCLSRKSPKISSQYLAILYCCGLLLTHTQTHTVGFRHTQHVASIHWGSGSSDDSTCSGSQRTE